MILPPFSRSRPRFEGGCNSQLLSANCLLFNHVDLCVICNRVCTFPAASRRAEERASRLVYNYSDVHNRRMSACEVTDRGTVSDAEGAAEAGKDDCHFESAGCNCAVVGPGDPMDF